MICFMNINIGITLTMMGVMVLMGIITIHIPRLLSYGNEWWMELLASTLFIIICICVVMIIRKPRHSACSRNSIPCVPLLPICAVWMDIHLIVCLPYTSWLAFLIWSLLGETKCKDQCKRKELVQIFLLLYDCRCLCVYELRSLE